MGIKNFAHVGSGFVKLATVACQQEPSGWKASRQLTARIASGKYLLNEDMVTVATAAAAGWSMISGDRALLLLLCMVLYTIFVCVKMMEKKIRSGASHVQSSNFHWTINVIDRIDTQRAW